LAEANLPLEIPHRIFAELEDKDFLALANRKSLRFKGKVLLPRYHIPIIYWPPES
jgi:hypothetical protein